MKEVILMLRTEPDALPEGRCLAGFSGGADSTALMMLLAAERDSGRIQPEAVHVNHGLRGSESDGDEAFCRKICEELEIRLHTIRAELNGKTDEDACRRERFRCFREIMEKTGIRNLVLAHNRDDLAETFLMRLIRGAGPEGLGCMSSRDERDGYTIFRPLLDRGREEIRQALRQSGIPWREDSLNESGEYLRNRVRKQLMPLMEEMNGDAAGRIARTAKMVTDEDRMLREETGRFLSQHSRGTWLDAGAAGLEPRAMQRRIVRMWWKQNAPEMDEHTLNARQTEELCALATANRGKVNLPGGLTAVKGKHGLYLTGLPKPERPEIPMDPEKGAIPVFAGITLRIAGTGGNPGNGKTEQEMPLGFLDGCVIRTRKPGDRIRPFGMEGSRKLQDYLTDRGIDEPLRDDIPLICRGNEVLMAAGVGTGAVPRWNGEAVNIRLIWDGEMPWTRR